MDNLQERINREADSKLEEKIRKAFDPLDERKSGFNLQNVYIDAKKLQGELVNERMLCQRLISHIKMALEDAHREKFREKASVEFFNSVKKGGKNG